MASKSIVKAPDWFEQLMRECPPLQFTPPVWNCDRTRERYCQYVMLAEWLGYRLMPWQQLVLWYLASPRCRELVLIVGRQCGKTTILLVPILHTLLYYAKNRRRAHRIVYSMQDGDEAKDKVKTEFMPVLQEAGFDESIGFKYNLAAGASFGISTNEGARLRTMSSGKNAIRGNTRVRLGIVDEARADQDTSRTKLLVPAQSIADDAQTVVASTAGDLTSILLERRLAEAQASLTDPESRNFLLTWGILREEDADRDDPAIWRRCLPAMDYTLREDDVRDAKSLMEEHEFDMEYLGIWLNAAIEQAFPIPLWKHIQRPNAELRGPVVLAIDGPPEQNFVAACVADRHGSVQLVDTRTETITSYDWVRALLARHDRIRSVCILKGSILQRTGERLEQDGVRVNWYDTAMFAKACARMWEDANESPSRVGLVSDSAFDDANRAAFKLELRAGGWVFRRQTIEVNCSALMAAAMGHDAAALLGEGVDLEDAVTMWSEVESAVDTMQAQIQADQEAGVAASSIDLDELSGIFTDDFDDDWSY